MLCRIAALTSGGISEPCAGQFGESKDREEQYLSSSFLKKRYVGLCDFHAEFLR